MEAGFRGGHVTSAVSLLQADPPKPEAGEEEEGDKAAQ